MQKPSSRTYLTRKQLATDFGSDPKAVEAITAYAKAHHLFVTCDARSASQAVEESRYILARSC